MTLRALGMINADGDDVTGENWLLDKLAQTKISQVVDVGANVSVYGYNKLAKNVRFIAFEPNPETFAQLKLKNYPARVKLYQQAVGRSKKSVKLFDFADEAPLKKTQPTATLASVNRQVIEQFHQQKAKSYTVTQVDLDSFLSKAKITQVDLLKIDVEGAELEVLKGAKKFISDQKIELIQFEFNEMHAYARVFFKDFVDFLHDYTLFRLGPHGLLRLGTYRPLTHEQFAFQNVLAISNRNLHKWLMIFHTADS